MSAQDLIEPTGGGFDVAAELDNFGKEEKQEEAVVDRLVPKEIHISLRQRNGRKTITTVEGMSEELDLGRMIKYLRKKFACNGTVITDKTHGNVIQFQGNQCDMMYEFLLGEGVPKDMLKVHGF